MYDIVFMGTPEFAVPALEALALDKAGRYRVAQVYTRPNAASGRGKALLPSPVRLAAERLRIPVVTPTAAEGCLQLPPCDFAVVSAFGMILTPELLAQPRYGFVNIHASILPRWHGAAPIQRAILAGDTQVGVSIMRVVWELDAGDFCAQATIEIREKDAPTLGSELSHLGAELLVEALPAIAEGTAQWTVQDPALVTYAAKVAKHEVALGPELNVVDNIRRVRASTPQAPARCSICGRNVTVLGVRQSSVGTNSCRGDHRSPGPAMTKHPPIRSGAGSSHAATTPEIAPPAVLIVDKRLFLSAVDGIFEVTLLKPDGKQAMSAEAFSTGLRDAPLVWAAL
jgi:methionyl-tRNA formyltransferase